MPKLAYKHQNDKSFYINTEDGKIFLYENEYDRSEQNYGREITEEELQELSEKYDGGVTFESYENEQFDTRTAEFEWPRGPAPPTRSKNT